MDPRNGASFVAFLLVNRLATNDTQPLTVSEFWKLAAPDVNLEALLTASPAEISALTGASDEIAERAHSLLAQGRRAALALEELGQSGIRIMTPFDDPYPARLREQLREAAPPLLFYAGDPSLLEAPSLAIVGSRHVGHEELEITRAAARVAVGRGAGVTSGGARGVDQVAMTTVFEQGGIVTGVLADSLVKTLRESVTRRAVLEGTAIFLSHQNPTAGFSVGAAMGRNKFVYALADVTFVVTAAAKSGGTWTGADEALRRGYGRVAVWMGAGRGPGNELLIEQGATPITDVDQLFSHEPNTGEAADEQEADQLRLGL